MEKLPTYEEAMAYYDRRGQVEMSAAVFAEGKRRGLLPEDVRRIPVEEFRKLRLLEKTLEDFLSLNLDRLEKGLRLVARQYPTLTGPLDMLARDSLGRWVVIELKRGRAGDRVVGQLLRYRGFIVRERAKGRENRVRGFVVAPEPDSRAIAAARGAGGVPLEIHQFVLSGQGRRLYPD